MRRSSAVMVVAVALVAACGSKASSTPTTVGATVGSSTTAVVSTTIPLPIRGGALTVGVEADTSNPWTPERVQCASACLVTLSSVLETLTVQAADGTVQPNLAESFSSDAAHQVWTFKLRTGIEYHDGTPFDAANVVDNLDREIRSFLTGAALVDVVGAPDKPQVVALDPMTVQVTLKRPWVDFPTFLANQPGLMGSSKWLAAADTDASVQAVPVGTGPFIFQSYQAGDRFVAVRNPKYWRKDASGQALPYLDKITFRVITDAQARAQALEAGDVDVIQTQDGTTITSLKDSSKLAVWEQSQNGETAYLLLHSGAATPGPLADKRVRCGLTAASNTDAWIATAAPGEPRANGPFSPGQPGHLDNNGAQGYDPAVAKALLGAYVAEHGPLTIHVTSTLDAGVLALAQQVQADWQAAGVKVVVDQLEQGKLVTSALAGAPSFEVYTWRGFAGSNMDNQYVWWHSANALPDGRLALNFGRIRDPILDDLLDRNRGTVDPALRQQLAEQANREWAQQCWMIPIYWITWGIGYHPNVHGITQPVTVAGDPERMDNGRFQVATVWRA